MPQPDLHAHYQLRLVQRFDGQRIVTHRPLAQAKSFKARDKTLDFTAGSERGALVVWFCGLNRFDKLCLQIKFQFVGKNFFTRNINDFATSTSTRNDPIKAAINAEPFLKLPVWMTANIHGNSMAIKMTNVCIFENALRRLKSDRSTINGGIFRMLESGKNENIPDMINPKSRPLKIAPQDIVRLISTGMN